MDEFALIDRWLSHFARRGRGVVLGPGDDAAALRPAAGRLLVTTVDALVDGVHFDRRWLPASAVGHKALAVNLSDLAAMGATPRWALLALGLPQGIAPRWLDACARGMAALCEATGVTLVGGNVSGAAELSLTVTLLGEVAPARMLRRAGAKAGDLVCVTGTLGDAAVGLASLAGRTRPPSRLTGPARRQGRPEARLALGRALGGIATACVDVSDGFAADLGHLLEASGVGAEVRLEDLPRSAAVRAAAPADDPFGPALSGGEDYELVFTVAPARLRRVRAAARRTGTQVTVVGAITAGRGLVLRDATGRRHRPRATGWRHT